MIDRHRRLDPTTVNFSNWNHRLARTAEPSLVREYYAWRYRHIFTEDEIRRINALDISERSNAAFADGLDQAYEVAVEYHKYYGDLTNFFCAMYRLGNVTRAHINLEMTKELTGVWVREN